jgi:hypothetical protein
MNATKKLTLNSYIKSVPMHLLFLKAQKRVIGSKTFSWLPGMIV